MAIPADRSGPVRCRPTSPCQRPLSERQALERERAELPGQISAHQAELAATPAANQARRERLDWQIRNLQKRPGAIEAQLAAISAER
jgi:chromosome segregation ATPase